LDSSNRRAIRNRSSATRSGTRITVVSREFHFRGKVVEDRAMRPFQRI
jgi:hypothetical protein